MWKKRLLRGFIVFLAIVVLTALFVPRVVGLGNGRSHFSRVHSELSTYKSLLDHFHLDCGRYPTTEEGLDALHVVPASLKDKWGPQPYTDKTSFDDPWGNPYLYLSNDPNQYTLKSYGEDGQPGGEGYAADIEAEP